LEKKDQIQVKNEEIKKNLDQVSKPAVAEKKKSKKPSEANLKKAQAEPKLEEQKEQSPLVEKSVNVSPDVKPNTDNKLNTMDGYWLHNQDKIKNNGYWLDNKDKVKNKGNKACANERATKEKDLPIPTLVFFPSNKPRNQTTVRYEDYKYLSSLPSLSLIVKSDNDQ
jgi:hypothetical protein